jgi:hypothetical protein
MTTATVYAKRSRGRRPGYVPHPLGPYREAIKATRYLLLCRNQRQDLFVIFPKDLIRIIAKLVYETRYDDIWMRARNLGKSFKRLEILERRIEQDPNNEELIEKREVLIDKIEAISESFVDE